jgi:hypothetical protein
LEKSILLGFVGGGTMSELCEGCKDHLEAAIEASDPAEKNYHIRQVLQVCGTEGIPDDVNVELNPIAET